MSLFIRNPASSVSSRASVTGAPPIFHMNSMERARRVTKDLKRLSEEFGCAMTHTQSQFAVAQMFGYPTWSALAKGVGKGPRTADDAAVSPAKAKSRAREQSRVLQQMGILENAADRIVEKLLPTERSRGVPTKANVVRMAREMDFHPRRILKIEEVVSETTDESIYEWYADRADRLELSGFDDLNYHMSLIDEEDALTSAEAVMEHAGFVVDASFKGERFNVAAGLRDIAPPDYSPPTIYLHFGQHALPSPIPGIGVEGCYVTFEDLGDPRRYGFRFVLSSMSGVDDDAFALHLPMPLQFRDHLRSFSMSLTPSAVETIDEAVSHWFESAMPQFADQEPYQAWRPYLPRLLRHAWNALREYCETPAPLMDIAVDKGWSETELRALSKASSDRARREIILDVVDRTDIPVVRYLGRPAPQPPCRCGAHSEFEPRVRNEESGRGAPFDQTHFLSLIYDASVALAPVDMNHLVGVANDYMTPYVAADSQAFSRANEDLMFLSIACLVNGMYETDEFDRAEDLMELMVKDRKRDPGDLLPAAVKVLLEGQNGAEKARAVLAAWTDSPSVSQEMALWTEATIAMYEEQYEQAAQLIRRAHPVNPDVVQAMIEGEEISFWFGRYVGPFSDPEMRQDMEAPHIAGMYCGLWHEDWQAMDLLLELVKVDNPGAQATASRDTGSTLH